MVRTRLARVATVCAAATTLLGLSGAYARATVAAAPAGEPRFVALQDSAGTSSAAVVVPSGVPAASATTRNSPPSRCRTARVPAPPTRRGHTRAPGCQWN